MISALASVALAAEYANTTGAANDSRNEDLLAEGGGGVVDSGPDGSHEFPAYIRTTSMVFCIFILGIGIIGNVMVPLVILKSRDMRNSTNIFLTNLSIADLMVLLVCTPTVLVEVNSKPETWVLGSEMCKAVPFVELTVAHASVLTILAISFERYYAICEPLKAGYVCTKERALLICFLAWAFAALFTSPILAVAEYRFEQYWDGTLVPVCITPADTFWKATYFVGTISVFFGIPLVLLVALYSVIARHLMVYPGIMASHQQQSHQQQGHGQPATPSAIKYRKQVVMMLGTVVLSFFICLLPFRAFTLWIIVVPPEDVMALGAAGYYNLLFFCRIMLYLNSAINPILYNLMSSKFRDGFMRLCGIKRCKKSLRRKGTFNTTTSTTTCSSSQNHRMSPEGFWRRSFTSGRGSLGGDSLRGVLQRKASTTSSDSAGAGPADRPPPHLLHAAVGGRRLESAPGMTASAAPLLNGGSVHHPLMEDVLEDVLEDALEAGTAPRGQDSGPKLGDEWC